MRPHYPAEAYCTELEEVATYTKYFGPNRKAHVTPAEVSPSEQAGSATVMSVYDEVTEVSEAHGGKPLGTFIH